MKKRRFAVESVFPRLLGGFVLILLLALGGLLWTGLRVVHQAVQERFLKERLAQVGGLVSELRLPPSHRLADSLKRLTGNEVIFSQRGGRGRLISTLPETISKEVVHWWKRQTMMAEHDETEDVSLGGETYWVAGKALYFPDVYGFSGQHWDLLLCIPVSQVQEVTNVLLRQLLMMGGGLLVLGIGLAALLARWITRPLQMMVEHADRLTRKWSESKELPTLYATGGEMTGFPEVRNGPREAAILRESLARMGHCLAEVHQRLAQFERLAAMGTLSASIMHEVKNPLSGLKMHVRLLHDSIPPDDKTAWESIRIIEEEIERMELFL
ncbi:MAG: HAMP domain-containing protein, partial [Lentisphaerae bacterium]